MIDTTKMSVTGTLAVVSQTGESLSFFDLSSGERIAQLTNLTSEPHELCYDPSRQLVYVSHTYRHGHYWTHGDFSHEISVVDVKTKEVIDIIDVAPAGGPHGLYMDHGRDVLYASVEQLPDVEVGGGVIGIDLKTRKVVKTIPSGWKTHWFVMTPDCKKAYCCNKTAEFISVLDLEQGKMVGKIEVPTGCEEPSMALDGKHVYFPTPGFKGGKNAEEPRIEVIDTATDKVVKRIELKKGALPVHVSPKGQILVGHYQFADKEAGFLEGTSAQLAVYDQNTYEWLGEVPIGLLPLTLRCSSDGKVAFAANVVSGTVSIVDVESMMLIKTLDVDDKKRDDKPVHVGAHGLAYIP